MADNDIKPGDGQVTTSTAIDTDEMRVFIRQVISDEIKTSLRSFVTRDDATTIARSQAELVFSERADILQKVVKDADTYVRIVEARINNTDGLLTSLRDVIKDLREEMRTQDGKSDKNATNIALLQNTLYAPGEHSFSGRLDKIEALLEALPGILQGQFKQETTKLIERIEPIEAYIASQQAWGERLRTAIRFLGQSPKLMVAIFGGGSAFGVLVTTVIEYLKAIGVIQ